MYHKLAFNANFHLKFHVHQHKGLILLFNYSPIANNCYTIISNSECSIKNSLEANCRIYSVQSQEHRHHWHHYQSKEIYKFKKRSMIIQFALILIEEETHQSMSELLTWPHFLCFNLFNNNYCFSYYSSRLTFKQKVKKSQN